MILLKRQLSYLSTDAASLSFCSSHLCHPPSPCPRPLYPSCVRSPLPPPTESRRTEEERQCRMKKSRGEERRGWRLIEREREKERENGKVEAGLVPSSSGRCSAPCASITAACNLLPVNSERARCLQPRPAQFIHVKTQQGGGGASPPTRSIMSTLILFFFQTFNPGLRFPNRIAEGD